MGPTRENIGRGDGIMKLTEPTLDVMIRARNDLQEAIRTQMGKDLTAEVLELACSPRVRIGEEAQEWQADKPVSIGGIMSMTERAGEGPDRRQRVTRLSTDESCSSITVPKPDGSALVFGQPGDTTRRVRFKHYAAAQMQGLN